MCISNSFAYFISDTILEIYFKTGDPGIYVHHVASIVLTYATLTDTYGGMAMVAGLFFGELTNPFYWYRNLLKRIGEEDTMQYQVVFWLY